MVESDAPTGRSLAETAVEVLARRADSLARESAEEETTDSISLLLFRLGEEWYAVGIDRVREIFQEYEITTIPCVPDHVLGVVNVRGEIISVTDPARLMRLGQIEIESGVTPAIVIVCDEVATAMVVDEIGDITDVPSESIEPPVSIIDRAQAEFIAGSVYAQESMIGLISVDKMLEPVGASAQRH